MNPPGQINIPKNLDIPHHVAVIMDGNGRWARKKRMPRAYGHRIGAQAVRRAIETAAEIGIKYLSLYTFSADNWQRPKKEVSTLMRLIEENLKKELPELHGKGVKIKVIGRLNELPLTLQEAFRDAIQITENNSTLTLQVAINYSGYNEILDAVQKITDLKIQKKVEEEEFKKFLYEPDTPYPDLLIRTGGERRISNFLLWQIAYTELWFTDVLWPDFTKDDFIKAIQDYSQRHRRFGKVDEI